MDRRPLLSRVGRLPTFVWRAMKEMHAVAIAVIGGVLFLLGRTFGPWLAQTFCPSIKFPSLNAMEIACGVLIVILTILAIGGYLVWEEEEYQHKALQERTESKISIEFRLRDERYLHPALTGVGRSLHIRVLPITPARVDNCVGYLEGIYRFVDNEWQSVGYTDRRPLHWSTIHERRVDRAAEQPVPLVQGSPQFLDIVDMYQRENGVFHPAVDIIPIHAAGVFVQYPTDLFKFVIRVIGQPPSDAVIALQMRRGQAWNEPEVTEVPV